MAKFKNKIQDFLLARRGLKYSAKRRLRNSVKEPIPLFWYRDTLDGIKNFGDELSSELIPELFGYRVKNASIADCELVAIGSNVDYLINNRPEDRPVEIWGSGYIRQDKTKSPSANFHFCAVRGKSTLKRIGSPEIPLGDPGILANIIYSVSGRKNGKIGIIPHYVDLDSEFVKRVKSDDRFVIISPLQSPSAVAEQISQCDAIFSSSLHGLIFADSFQVPNAHICLSEKVIGGSYKFKDYCSGVGKEYLTIAPEDIFDDKIVRKTLEQYQPIENLEDKQRALVAAFPYK